MSARLFIGASAFESENLQRGISNSPAGRNRRALALASSVLCLGAASHIASANTTATWNGPAGLGGSGNWTDAASWSTGVVPENTATTSYDVAIDGGKPAASTVTIGSGSFQVDNLTVDANSALDLGDGASLTLAGDGIAATASVNGIINLGSVVSITDLIIAGNTSLIGTGTVQLSNNANNQFYASGNQTLTIGSGQSILGAGQIGIGQTVVVNNGAIDADSSAGMTISVSGAASTNNGLIEAQNGSTLTLVGTYTNAGSGAITATDTAAIVLNSANISGDSITGTATGMISSNGTSALNNLTVNGPLVNNATLTLSTVTFTGSYTASNGSLTLASGSLSNGGIFTLDSGGTTTDLQITATTALNGAGTIEMSNFVNNRIYASANQTLTVGSGQTIQGAGQIGIGQTVIVNNGTIDADVSAGMIISPGAGGLTNNHVIEANGAVLAVAGSFANTSGTISALSGGEVQFTGSTVTRGILSTTGTGFIAFASADTLSSVTINGNSNEQNDATVTIAGGALANNGVYSISSTGGFTDLIVNGNTSINGTGTVQLSNFTTNRIYAANNQTLTVGSGQTIQGSGQIGVSQTLLANNGIIDADSSAGLTIDVSKTTSTNSNLIEAQDGATLGLTGEFTNTGSGAFAALDTAAIIFNSANISGNSITGTQTGMITSYGTSALNNMTVNGPVVNNSGMLALNTVVLTGNFTAENDSITNASGAVTNNALFTLSSTGGNTDFVITANTSLSGAGAFQMSNFPNNRIYAASNQTLTIGSGQTIQGAGQIGIGQTSFINNGVIDANSSAGIAINPSAGGFTNNNLIEASDAVLTLEGSFTNTAGSIDALAGGEVRLTAAAVTGGIFSATGNGLIDFAFTDTINNVTFNGNSNQENGTVVTVAGGALANIGIYTMNSTGASTDLAVNANTSISGNGTFQLSNNANNRIYATGNQTLTVGGGQTIQGAGQIGLGQTVLVNNGIINASTSAGLTINVSGTTSVSNGFMEATSGATLDLLGTMANTGTVSPDGASTILMAGVFNQTGGTLFNPGAIVVTGTLTSSAASFITNTGAFRIDQGGTTTIATGLAGGGNVTVGDPSGPVSHLTVQSIGQNSLLINATGFVTIANNNFTTANALNSLTINSGGTLNLGNNHLFIDYGAGPDPVGSVAALLATGFNGGAWNGPGIDSSAAAVNPGYGVGYADAADPGNPAGLSSGTIEIKYTLLGDATLQGLVNATDFGILAANFNKGATRWDQGDFNYGPAVNATDFADLAANFNKGASGASFGPSALSDPAFVEFAEANGLMADVPEPAAVGSVAIIAAVVLGRRRRLR